MTLNQLEYFCAVCRFRNITRAAEALYVSQPTISLAIKELEKEFHLQFFYHEKNRVTLTSDGEAFYQYAQALLQKSQEMHTVFSSLGTSTRPIRIGIPPLISTVFFPELEEAFVKETGCAVQLFEYGSLRACNMVEAQELDLAIVNMDFYNISRYQMHTMMTDATVFCVARSHYLAKEPFVTLEMLREEPVIMYNTDSVLNQTIHARYRNLRITPRTILHSSQLYSIYNFVRKGNCGAFLYSSLLKGQKEFVGIPLKPDLKTSFGLIWKNGILRPDAQKFIDFVREYDFSKYIGV